MKKLFFMVMIAVTGSYGTIKAQQPAVIVSDKAGWHKIGETTADFKKETDEIVVVGADRFSSLKLKVTDMPIDLIAMDVYFEGGEKQSERIGMQIKSPGETRMIDLNKGKERDLKKVVFTYKTMPNQKNDKAHVELWGLKTNADKK